MQPQWILGSGRGPAIGLAALGIVLILIGLLLFIKPEILAYVVASVFFVGGVSLLGSAWRLRSAVSIRRLDESWEEQSGR
jgi:uncharacterized membrane protein HdeD (DUF308 family)